MVTLTMPVCCLNAGSHLSSLTGSADYPMLERVMGIEPTLSAWEAEVLPLNYTRRFSGSPLPLYYSIV
jgi:hypothetical protein